MVMTMMMMMMMMANLLLQRLSMKICQMVAISPKIRMLKVVPMMKMV